jgi:hypothetical protein
MIIKTDSETYPNLELQNGIISLLLLPVYIGHTLGIFKKPLALQGYKFHASFLMLR